MLGVAYQEMDLARGQRDALAEELSRVRGELCRTWAELRRTRAERDATEAHATEARRTAAADRLDSILELHGHLQMVLVVAGHEPRIADDIAAPLFRKIEARTPRE